MWIEDQKACALLGARCPALRNQCSTSLVLPTLAGSWRGHPICKDACEGPIMAYSVLQEVGYICPRRDHGIVLFCFLKELCSPIHVFVELEDGGDVPASVAVVGCRPHGDQGLFLEHVLESFLHELMGAADEFQSVDLVELGGDLGSEQPTCTPWRCRPGVDLFRIRPHEVAEGPFVGDLAQPFDGAHLVQGAQVRREATMHTQDPSIDDSGQRQVIEHFCAIPPGIGVAVLALALVVEAVDLGDLPALVVAAQQRHVRWIPRLEQQQQREHFQAVVSTIHEITL